MISPQLLVNHKNIYGVSRVRIKEWQRLRHAIEVSFLVRISRCCYKQAVSGQLYL